MLITRVILMVIGVVMHGQGRVTRWTTRFLLIKLFFQSFCVSTCLDYDHLEYYGANAQNSHKRIHKSYFSPPIHTKRCYWAVILERMESRTLESHESLQCLVCLVCQVCQCLSRKTYTCCKNQIGNLKPNCIYSMQSVEQHYSHYRETEEQNSNGCKLLVKKDAMLDSLDARERSYDNSANGINFTIRKVNLMFVFIVVVWIFFLINTWSKILCFFCKMLLC